MTPNIAYVFLLLGIYGLIFELYNPGAILPGVVGVICLILAFYSLATLPINYAGVALILFGILLFLLEIKIASYGLLSVGGAVSLLLGSVMLINSESSLEFISISWAVILPAVLLTVAFFVFAIGMGVRAQRRKPTTGVEGIVGETGEAVTDMSPEGQVRVQAVHSADTSTVTARGSKLNSSPWPRPTGFEIEIISGEEEARRTLLGIRSGLPAGITAILCLDIGGGSTEFILDRPGHAPVVRSIEIGVVRLTERMLRHDPPTTDEIRATGELVRKEKEQATAWLGLLDGVSLVRTAASITTLAAMAQKLSTYEPRRIHNYRLSLDTIKELERAVLSKTIAQRRGMPGLEAGREEVVVAGTLILRGVMETLGFSEGLVSDLGLREGILLDLAARQQK